MLATIVGYEGENGLFEVTRFDPDFIASLGVEGIAEIRIPPAAEDRDLFVQLRFNPPTQTPDEIGSALILTADGQVADIDEPEINLLPNGFPADFQREPIRVAAGQIHQDVFLDFPTVLNLTTSDLFDPRRTVDVVLYEKQQNFFTEVVKVDEVRIPAVDILGGDLTFFPNVDPANDAVVFQTPELTVPLDNLRRVVDSLPLANPDFDPLVVPDQGPPNQEPIFEGRDTFEPITSGLAGLVKGTVRDPLLTTSGFAIQVSAPALRDEFFFPENESEPFRITDPRTGRGLAVSTTFETVESGRIEFPPGTKDFAIDLSEVLETTGFAGIGGPLARSPLSPSEITVDGVFSFTIEDLDGNLIDNIEVFPRVRQDVNLTSGYQTDANHFEGERTELTVILDQYFRQLPQPGGGFRENPATVTVDFGDGSSPVEIALPQFSGQANRGQFEHDFKGVFTHVYDELGEFTSRVVFEDSAGNTAISINTVEIKAKPDLRFFPSRFVRKDAETGIVTARFSIPTEDFELPTVSVGATVLFNGEIVETDFPEVVFQDATVTQLEAKAEVDLLPGNGTENEISGETNMVAQATVVFTDPITLERQENSVRQAESLFIAPLLPQSDFFQPFVSQKRLFHMTGGSLPKVGANGFGRYIPEFQTSDELLGDLAIEVTAPVIRQGTELVNLTRQFSIFEGPGLRDFQLPNLTSDLATHFVATPETFRRGDLSVNTADPQFVYRLLRIEDTGFEIPLDELIVPLGSADGPSTVPDNGDNLVTNFSATDPFIFIDIRAPGSSNPPDSGAGVEFREAVSRSSSDGEEPFERVSVSVRAFNLDDETNFSLTWRSSQGDIDLPLTIFQPPVLGAGKQGDFVGTLPQDGGELVARVTGRINELSGNSLAIETVQPLRVRNVAPEFPNFIGIQPPNLAEGMAGSNTVVLGVETAPDADRIQVHQTQFLLHAFTSILDPGDDIQQVAVDWGDGTLSQFNIDGFQFDQRIEHTYTDQFLKTLPLEGPVIHNGQNVTARFVRPIITTFDGNESASTTLRIQVLDNVPIQIFAGDTNVDDEQAFIDVDNPSDIMLVLPTELLVAATEVGFELNVTIDSAHTDPQQFTLIREAGTPADRLRVSGPIEQFVPFDLDTGQITLTRIDAVQLPQFSLPSSDFESVPFVIRAETEGGLAEGDIPVVRNSGAYVASVRVEKDGAGNLSGTIILGGENPNGTDVELEFVGGGTATVNVPAGQNQTSFSGVDGFESIAPLGSTVFASSAGRDGIETTLIADDKETFDLRILILGNSIPNEEQTVRIDVTALVGSAAEESIDSSGETVVVNFDVDFGDGFPESVSLQVQAQPDGSFTVITDQGEITEVFDETFLDLKNVFNTDRSVIVISDVTGCIVGQGDFFGEDIAPKLSTPEKIALSKDGRLNLAFEVNDTEGELIQVTVERESTGDRISTNVRVNDGVAEIRIRDLLPGIETGEQVTVIANDGNRTDNATIEIATTPNLELDVSADELVVQGGVSDIEIDITSAVTNLNDGIPVDFTIDLGDGDAQPLRIELTSDEAGNVSAIIEDNGLGLDFEITNISVAPENPTFVLTLKDVPFAQEGAIEIAVGDGVLACATGSTTVNVVNDEPVISEVSIVNTGGGIDFEMFAGDADASTVEIEIGGATINRVLPPGGGIVRETIDAGDALVGQTLTVSVEDADGAKTQQTFVVPPVDFCQNHPFFPTEAVFTGNVTVSVDGGNVVVTGDDEDNGVSIIADARGVVAVPAGGTTINGAAGDFVLFPGVGTIAENLNIQDMRDGDDFVCLHAFDVGGSLIANMNTGDDVYVSKDVAVIQSIDLLLGQGNDRADLTGTTINGSASLSGSEGNDTIIGSDSDDEIEGGEGVDELRGGGGDDDFLVADLIDRVLAGGDGVNRIVGLGSDATLDLDAAVATSITEVFRIDLDTAATNSLRLSPDSVSRVFGDEVDLIVQGDVDDQIDIGEGWEKRTPETIDGRFHQVFFLGQRTLRVANGQPFQNVLVPTDVNDDGTTSVLDALLILNALSRAGTVPASLDATRPTDGPLEFHFVDVNGDQQISVIDALLVINDLARQIQTSVAGELVAIPTLPADRFYDDDPLKEEEQVILF